jgi:hypothetical protein
MGFESFRGLFDCWRFWKKKKNKLLLYLKILLFSSKIPSERPPRTQPPFHKLIIGLGSSELMPSCTPKDLTPHLSAVRTKLRHFYVLSTVHFGVTNNSGHGLILDNS